MTIINMTVPVTQKKIYVMWCPRCDRKYTSSVSQDDVLEIVKRHVAGQHPNHDPFWFDTYPEAFGN